MIFFFFYLSIKLIFFLLFFYLIKEIMLLNNSFIYFSQITLKEKMESFGPRKLSHCMHGGTKIRPRITSNWRIFESN